MAAPLLIAVVAFGAQAETLQSQHQSGTEDVPDHHHHAAGSHWSAPKHEQKRSNPIKADVASIKQAELLFQTHCSACHGEHGEGNGPSAAGLANAPPNLKEMASHHTDGDLAWKIAEGRGLMPGWKAQLKPQEIWSLVNYVKHLARL